MIGGTARIVRACDMRPAERFTASRSACGDHADQVGRLAIVTGTGSLTGTAVRRCALSAQNDVGLKVGLLRDGRTLQ